MLIAGDAAARTNPSKLERVNEITPVGALEGMLDRLNGRCTALEDVLARVEAPLDRLGYRPSRQVPPGAACNPASDTSTLHGQLQMSLDRLDALVDSFRAVADDMKVMI